MADTAINSLTELSIADIDDVLAIVDTSVSQTKKIEVGSLVGAGKFISGYNGDFDAAVTAIGATEATLIIDVEATMSTNVTVPATLSIFVLKGGTINQSTYTLTINGPFEAGLFRVFTGTGTVTFGNIMDGVKPEWWYSGSGSYHTAIAAADAAYASVLFSKNTYALTTGVTQAASHAWRGIGPHESKITLSGAITGITFGNYGKMVDLWIYGNDTAGQVGIKNTSSAGQWCLDNLRIEHCDVGLELSNTWIGSIINPEIRYNATGVEFSDTVATPVNNNISVFGGSIHENTTNGVLLNHTGGTVNGLTFFGTNIEDNTSYGFRLQDGTAVNVRFINAWIEGNLEGISVEKSTAGFTVENSRIYLTDSSSSKGIDFSAGTHNGIRIIGNDIDRTGSSATTAIEFTANCVRPRVELNSIDSNLSIVDNSTTSMHYVDEDGLVYMPGITSVAGGSRVTGNNFSGTVTLSNPNTTAAVSFSTNEPDTSYGVYVACPGWDCGDVWVTSKAVSGFTINVGTTIPAGSESLYWMIIRR